MDDEVKDRRVRTNGIWMHIAEQGSGPLLLLFHGFPELSFILMAPPDHSPCRQRLPCRRSRHERLRRHRLSSPPLLLHLLPSRRRHCRPPRRRSRNQLSALYLMPFYRPGRAEKAFGRYDCSTVIKKFLLIDKDDPLIAPPGVEIIDFLHTPSALPSWISEEEIQFFAQKFDETGFTGGLNYYRAMDLNCELLGPWNGSKVTVPVKLIVGDKDIGFSVHTKSYIEGPEFKELVPNLEVVVLADAHHFIQQERPQEITDEILSFTGKLSS